MSALQTYVSQNVSFDAIIDGVLNYMQDMMDYIIESKITAILLTVSMIFVLNMVGCVYCVARHRKLAHRCNAYDHQIAALQQGLRDAQAKHDVVANRFHQRFENLTNGVLSTVSTEQLTIAISASLNANTTRICRAITQKTDQLNSDSEFEYLSDDESDVTRTAPTTPPATPDDPVDSDTFSTDDTQSDQSALATEPKIINNAYYYATTPNPELKHQRIFIYAMSKHGAVGDEVGEYVKGTPKFYKQ